MSASFSFFTLHPHEASSALGAKVKFDHGGVTLSGRLRGAVIYLDMPSVGATENLLMAATLASGTTRIENAAKEPEIVDLAAFLNAMGARVSGAGTSTIVIEGVRALHGVSWQPIADRIEAGTMACACAITGGELLLSGARAEHLRSLLFKLSEAGIHIKDTPGGLMVFGRAKQPFEIRTMVYPGFPTDLQAPMMAVACKTPGTSVFLETIFENRFMHAAVVKLHLCAQRAHALEVLVDGPLADRAAAGQGNARFAQPREQRAEHQHRGAHLAYILFVLRVLQRGGVQNERVVLLFHAAPARGQQRAERLHIRQFRHAFNARVFARQQRAAHDGQHRVLGCADGYFSPQRRAFANRIMRHENPSDFFRLCGGEPA